jgi:hypothetical protein
MHAFENVAAEFRVYPDLAVASSAGGIQVAHDAWLRPASPTGQADQVQAFVRRVLAPAPLKPSWTVFSFGVSAS